VKPLAGTLAVGAEGLLTIIKWVTVA